MKRIHYLLLGLAVSLCIAAVSPSSPPVRLVASTGMTITTNGLNNFTLAAAGGGGTLNGLATNLSVYSSGTTNRALRVFGTNGTSEVYVDKDANIMFAQTGSIVGPNGSSITVGALSGNAYLGNASRFGASMLVSDSRVGIGYLIPLGWSSTSDSYVALDTALNRASAGVIEINNGTAGQYRDLIARTVTVTNLAFNGGATITKVLTATASLDFSVGAGLVQDLTISVTGAALGDVVTLGVPNASVTATVQYTAWVSAANTVTVRARTIAVEDQAAGTFRATVVQH